MVHNDTARHDNLTIVSLEPSNPFRSMALERRSYLLLATSLKTSSRSLQQLLILLSPLHSLLLVSCGS